MLVIHFSKNQGKNENEEIENERKGKLRNNQSNHPNAHRASSKKPMVKLT